MLTTPKSTPKRQSNLSGDVDEEDFDEEEESDYDYDSPHNHAVFTKHSQQSRYSMFLCNGRCPAGRFGPYCRQTCNCPAGLQCNQVSGNCECPEGQVCIGTGGRTTGILYGTISFLLLIPFSCFLLCRFLCTYVLFFLLSMNQFSQNVSFMICTESCWMQVFFFLTFRTTSWSGHKNVHCFIQIYDLK